jgi:hypothetical protein
MDFPIADDTIDALYLRALTVLTSRDATITRVRIVLIESRAKATSGAASRFDSHELPRGIWSVGKTPCPFRTSLSALETAQCRVHGIINLHHSQQL